MCVVGGCPQHGKASRRCLLQGLSERLSEEMQESMNFSTNADWKSMKVFHTQSWNDLVKQALTLTTRPSDQYFGLVVEF